MEKEKDNGKVTVGYGTPAQHDLKIKDYINGIFIDDRLVSVLELEDDTIVLSVENKESSGRNPRNHMRLSKESFYALVSNCQAFLEAKMDEFKGYNEKVSVSGEVRCMASDKISEYLKGNKNQHPH